MVQNGQGKNYMKDKKKENSITEEGKVFFDTNILIYSIDENDAYKQNVAKELLEKAAATNTGIISTQSLQEFYNVAVKKLKLSKQTAKEYVDFFSRQFPVQQISVSLILDAIDISIKKELSFWDSLIISAANDTGCIIVYSEDMNDGQIVEGTKILNPCALTAA